MATQTTPPTTAVAQKEKGVLGRVQDLLTQFKGQIAMALPRHITPERMIRVALTSISQSPKLQQCDPLTICGAVVQASILGLEPSSVLGEAFLVPYKNNKRIDPVTKKKGVYECQLQVGYKGHIKLARNSGDIAMVDAQLVHESDDFDFEKGESPWLKHKWAKTGLRGDVIGCWAGFKTKDGVFNFEYMAREEIEEHRDRYSKSIDFNTKEVIGPWIDSPEWMYKKTPLIKVLKLAPKSIQMQTAISLTETSEAGTQQKFTIDVPFELQPPVEDDTDGDDGGAHKALKEPQRRVAEAKPPSKLYDYADWDRAQESADWQKDWIRVAGKTYQLVEGNYREPVAA